MTKLQKREIEHPIFENVRAGDKNHTKMVSQAVMAYERQSSKIKGGIKPKKPDSTLKKGTWITKGIHQPARHWLIPLKADCCDFAVETFFFSKSSWSQQTGGITSVICDRKGFRIPRSPDQYKVLRRFLHEAQICSGKKSSSFEFCFQRLLVLWSVFVLEPGSERKVILLVERRKSVILITPFFNLNAGKLAHCTALDLSVFQQCLREVLSVYCFCAEQRKFPPHQTFLFLTQFQNVAWKKLSDSKSRASLEIMNAYRG